MATEFQEFNLYKESVKVKFFPDSHQYWVNGKRKTGVTTILGIIDKSRPLVIWATELMRDFLLDILKKGITEDHIYKGAILHEERKVEAATIGDKVHGWIEEYVKGKNPEMPKEKEVQIGVNAFLEWESQNKVKFLSSERVVYSKKHDYIGTMDIEAKVNEKLCLIDVKTAGGLYNTNALQVAAYAKADEEESGKEYHGRWIIRLAKETEDEYAERMETKNVSRLKNGKKPIEIQPYQVFEAMFLDNEPGNMDRDYKAFLCAKSLYEWNKETNFFLNGKP